MRRANQESILFAHFVVHNFMESPLNTFGLSKCSHTFFIC